MFMFILTLTDQILSAGYEFVFVMAIVDIVQNVVSTGSYYR